jgi:hypothetical protein
MTFTVRASLIPSDDGYDGCGPHNWFEDSDSIGESFPSITDARAAAHRMLRTYKGPDTFGTECRLWIEEYENAREFPVDTIGSEADWNRQEDYGSRYNTSRFW